MTNIIDKAFKNFAALPPLEQVKVKAAFSGIGMFGLYLLYEIFTNGWKHAIGIFLAIVAFITVLTIAGTIGNAFGKIFGEKAGTNIAVILLLGFIGMVLYFILINWG